jgi:hypothetical protein
VDRRTGKNLRPTQRNRLRRLRTQRQKLSTKLARLDTEISKLAASARAPAPEQFDRWLDELTAGLGDLPALPADFSRADL